MVGMIAHIVAGQAVPAALVIGNGLALSSTAVVLQVAILRYLVKIIPPWAQVFGISIGKE